MNKEKIAALFDGCNETMVWSCLSGCMGYIVTDDDENPSSAQAVLGDFCFFAGHPDELLAQKAAAPLIIPQNKDWETVIEKVWGDRIIKELRYSIKKETDIFDKETLNSYVKLPNSDYSMKLIDRAVYEQASCEDWSRDLCSQFADYSDYEKRGLGAAILYKGRLAAGASSYSIYPGGIEIEIDTKPEYRRKGLALACGARLILECIQRGLYPSWDAHDMRSVALAEKLGYHMDSPYTAYIMKDAVI